MTRLNKKDLEEHFDIKLLDKHKTSQKYTLHTLLKTDGGKGMNFMELAEKRYSVRKYEQKTVEEEKLQAILEAGRIAPTGANKQPQKVYVLQSSEIIERYKSVCKHHYGAPIILLVCADESKAWHSPWNEDYNCSEIDISIVITYMMLEAVEQ